MRVPSWIPTSALVGMLIFVVVYFGLFMTYLITDNDGWLVAAVVSVFVYWLVTILHIGYRRRRRS